jgi:hypothetical protein
MNLKINVIFAAAMLLAGCRTAQSVVASETSEGIPSVQAPKFSSADVRPEPKPIVGTQFSQLPALPASDFNVDPGGAIEKMRPVVCGPLFYEATYEFTTMTTTMYQHRTRVDREAGSYEYDCVGFVSYALRQAAPQAWATVFKATGLTKGHIPSPSLYRSFFAGLAAKPQPGWEAVAKVSDLRPGDVVAWEHKTETSSGHAVLIGSTPLPLANGLWSVEVYDSTSAPHSDDSRPKDRRAQAQATTGRPSGLGHGTMLFIADPANGTLTGVAWGRKSKRITVPIAAGRPTS